MDSSIRTTHGFLQLMIVVLNAGAGAVVAGIAGDLAAGVALAREAIRNGRALAALNKLRELSRQFAAATPQGQVQ